MAVLALTGGAIGGLFRSAIDPYCRTGASWTAGSWRGLAFNAISGIIAAWALSSFISGEESLLAGVLYGYVGSDILDSLMYILLHGKNNRLKRKKHPRPRRR